MNDNVKVLIDKLNNNLNEANSRFEYFINSDIMNTDKMEIELRKIVLIEMQLSKLKVILDGNKV
jgi:hypothetical protein